MVVILMRGELVALCSISVRASEIISGTGECSAVCETDMHKSSATEIPLGEIQR